MATAPSAQIVRAVEKSSHSDEFAPRHSPECLCAVCERLGLGFFAQRAALAGDPSAAHRLSAHVFAVLTAEREASPRSRRHGG
jgi:hypothetical protein